MTILDFFDNYKRRLKKRKQEELMQIMKSAYPIERNYNYIMNRKKLSSLDESSWSWRIMVEVLNCNIFWKESVSMGACAGIVLKLLWNPYQSSYVM